ncbi:MAG: GYD domain-containing protein [Dehalococcoidia bacterium]|nr:GYD domain-containing protein [Dehalococcoidia bacterium]
MSAYIVFVGLTQQGAKDLKKLPATIKSAARVLNRAGVKVKGFHLVMGMDHYDGFFIIQADDDKKAAAAALALGAQGNLHTNTLRSFSEAELKEIITNLP